MNEATTPDDSAPASTTAPDLRRRPRWFRFSLTSLLVIMLVISIVCAWYAKRYREYLLERAQIVPTGFDIATGKNVLWSAKVGSVSYGGPVVSGDKVYVGTNNASGYLARYPSNVDLGVLLCFRTSDGKLLWQASSEKLPTGRVHDWPLQGVTSTPYVEGDRLWYVTNRCEVVCLDTEGFHDDEDDGIQDNFDPGVPLDQEADTLWRLDMMAQLGVSPHNASCSRITASADAVFVVTGNGIDESHINIPAADAPSFLALDKNSGKVLWSDDSPNGNILHGQWGSPTYAVLGGVPQVLFPGGDGWLYSFDPQGTPDGQGKLLWKFDCNPKDSKWILGGRGKRNNLLNAPTVYNGLVYIAVGQDPEHGEGIGHVWCIDPTRRGDVSPELVFNSADPRKPIPHRRTQACDEQQGDFTKPNPNSALVWHYKGTDLDGDREVEFEETMHRSLGRVAIKNNLAIVSDTTGIVHCIDAKTGRAYWTYDLLASCWSTPLISAQHVYVTDEDGDVAVFRLSADPNVAMPGGNPISVTTVSHSAYASPCSANNVLYILTKQTLHAIADPRRKQ